MRLLWLVLALQAVDGNINDRHRLSLLEPLLPSLPMALQRQLYSEFVAEFGKEFSDEKFFVFQRNLEKVVRHNHSNAGWKMGINAFSDLTFDQFRDKYLLKEPQNCSATVGNYLFRNSDIPESFDWRTKGVVSPVKNQLRCGSCWTFSTTGCLEAHVAIKQQRKLLLSEQQLLDCAGDFDNHGCNGGLPSHAFTYLMYAGGIMTEDDYPYQAKQLDCKFSKEKVVAQVKGGSVNITAENEAELTEAIAEQGPVSVAFQVVDDFRNYHSGVYTSTKCKNGPEDVNHAVLAVGYGVEDGKKHYIIKNSWSEKWGDQGYFKIERDVNMCGIAQCNSYPKLEEQDVKKTSFM